MFTIDDNEIHISREAIFIDASGSIDIKLVERNLNLWWALALKKYPNDFEVHLACFDQSRVYNVMKLTKANIDDMLQYKLVGGGGSDLPVCWEYMRKHNMKIGLVLTDGYLQYGDNPNLNIFFLIHSGNNHITPPYGEVGYI